MRRVYRFTAFAAVILATSLALAVPASLKPPEKDRLRKQIEVFAKDIDKQPKERKLLYMALMLQAREYTKVIEFYEKLDKAYQDELFIQMACIQSLIANNVCQAAADMIDSVDKKYVCNRLRAQAWCLYAKDCMACSHGLARRCSLKAIQADQTYAPAYYMLGEQSEGEENDHAKAIAYYVQTLALEQPYSVLARRARRDLLDELERHPDAAPK